MLVLTLKENETVTIGEEIALKVVKIRKGGGGIRVAFAAPPSLSIKRKKRDGAPCSEKAAGEPSPGTDEREP